MFWTNPVLDLVYPRVCIACGQAVRDARVNICWNCRAMFTIIADPVCAICGDPADGAIEHDYTCSTCNAHRPSFDLARSAARYCGPLRDVIRSFKYGLATYLASDLIPLLTGCVRTHYRHVSLDMVCFVPLHHVRERSRTYNQTELLASALARELGLDLFAGALRRIRRTRQQTDMNASERRENVRDAFAADTSGWIEGKNVLLVDDVMTTGSTVNACASELKRHGAGGVFVATVARG